MQNSTIDNTCYCLTYHFFFKFSSMFFSFVNKCAWRGWINFLPEGCSNNLLVSDSDINNVFTNLSDCEIS